MPLAHGPDGPGVGVRDRGYINVARREREGRGLDGRSSGEERREEGSGELHEWMGRKGSRSVVG